MAYVFETSTREQLNRIIQEQRDIILSLEKKYDKLSKTLSDNNIIDLVQGLERKRKNSLKKYKVKVSVGYQGNGDINDDYGYILAKTPLEAKQKAAIKAYPVDKDAGYPDGSSMRDWVVNMASAREVIMYDERLFIEHFV